VRKDNPPFVRAAGSTRVVDSAHNWTAGSLRPMSFLLAPLISSRFPNSQSQRDQGKIESCPTRDGLRHSILLPVQALISCKGNLTLNDGMCPNSIEADEESKTWLKIFAPSLTERLNSAAPGAHLKNKDVHNLMSLCPFHSQVTMAPSPFCGLFSEDEFSEGYEYHADLSKFYSNG